MFEIIHPWGTGQGCWSSIATMLSMVFAYLGCIVSFCFLLLVHGGRKEGDCLS